jgi:hypothetical protein
LPENRTNGCGSDRAFAWQRPAALAALCIVLGLLSGYSAFHHPWLSYRDCVSDPVRHDGRLVGEFHEPLIGEIRRDGFELLQRGEAPVFVFADTTGLISGEFVSLKAVFHKDGSLTATVAVVASRRREKMILSLFPAVLILLLFFKYFRFIPKRFEFEPRSHA